MSQQHKSKFLLSYELDDVLMTTSIGVSVIFSLILIIIIKDKKFSYSKLMFNIILAETVSVFSTMWFIIKLLNKDVKNYFTLALEYLHILIIKDRDIIGHYIDKLNIILFQTFQTYAISMNMCICIEMILTLRDPVAKVERRVFLYLFITYLLIIAEIVVLMCVNLTVVDNDDFIGYILFSTKTLGIDYIFRMIKVIIFILFVLVGWVSIFYIILRFRKNTNIAESMRNKFVFKHVCSVLLYILFYAPYQYYEFLFVTKREDFNIEDYKLIDVNILASNNSNIPWHNVLES